MQLLIYCYQRAKISTFPDFMIGDATSRPTINDIDYSFWKTTSKASNNGDSNKTPCLAGLKITGLPIIKAGISNVKFHLMGNYKDLDTIQQSGLLRTIALIPCFRKMGATCIQFL
jgi:hypothetical protein